MPGVPGVVRGEVVTVEQPARRVRAIDADQHELHLGVAGDHAGDRVEERPRTLAVLEPTDIEDRNLPLPASALGDGRELNAEGTRSIAPSTRRYDSAMYLRWRLVDAVIQSAERQALFSAQQEKRSAAVGLPSGRSSRSVSKRGVCTRTTLGRRRGWSRCTSPTASQLANSTMSRPNRRCILLDLAGQEGAPGEPRQQPLDLWDVSVVSAKYGHSVHDVFPIAIQVREDATTIRSAPSR